MKRFAVLAAMTLVLAGCNESQTSSTSSGSSTATTGGSAAAEAPATANATTPAGGAGEITMPNGLKYEDLVVGGGAEAKSGSDVKVHYTGTFPDGREFDSSRNGGQPYPFRLGAGQVIRGWDEGVVGMRVGGKRKLTIPSELAYGRRGAAGGVIPPDATLLFDVELVDVR